METTTATIPARIAAVISGSSFLCGACFEHAAVFAGTPHFHNGKGRSRLSLAFGSCARKAKSHHEFPAIPPDCLEAVPQIHTGMANGPGM